eukprot:scaffold58068_cov31-Tisochrysis_lutea.AAC.2
MAKPQRNDDSHGTILDVCGEKDEFRGRANIEATAGLSPTLRALLLSPYTHFMVLEATPSALLRRCALSGADGVLLDFLLVVAIFLVLLPPAVARICGAEWRLPCGCAATRGKPAELSPQLHESSQRSHTTANGTQLSLLSSPSALDVKDSLQAHQLHAARKGFGKSADVVASRSTDILSSISSVKSMVSNRVLGGRSVTFDAIEPRVFARMRFAAGFSKRELLASIQTIDDAGGGLKGE